MLQRDHPVGPSVTPITDEHLPRLVEIAREYARPTNPPPGPATGYAPTPHWHSHDAQQRGTKFLDVMVPAPKSVSVLWALEKRKRTIRAISDAHMEAVSAAAIELQRSAGSVRIGPAYFDTVLNIYRLEHYSNDRNDPFLHTHLIVDTEVHDGSRHGSLDVPALQDAVEVVGAHYQLSLERELWSRLKVAFEERRGRRDRQLCGIDNELTNVFADGSCQLGFRQFMATP